MKRTALVVGLLLAGASTALAQVVEGGFGAARSLPVEGGPVPIETEPTAQILLTETGVATVEEIVFSESGVEVHAVLRELVAMPGYADLKPIRLVGQLNGIEDGAQVAGTVTWTRVEADFAEDGSAVDAGSPLPLEPLVEDGSPVAVTTEPQPGNEPTVTGEGMSGSVLETRWASLSQVLRSDVVADTIMPPGSEMIAAGDVEHMVTVARKLLEGEAQEAGTLGEEGDEGADGADTRDGTDGAAGAGGSNGTSPDGADTTSPPGGRGDDPWSDDGTRRPDDPKIDINRPDEPDLNDADTDLPKDDDKTKTPPPGGDTKTPPPGGDTKTPPPGGDTKTPPPGGDTKTPPPGGDTKTPPPGGDTKTPPPGGDTKTPPPGGDTTDDPPYTRDPPVIDTNRDEPTTREPSDPGGTDDSGGGEDDDPPPPAATVYPTVTTKVTEDGCVPVVDLGAGQVWVSRRTERYEDGELVDPGECATGMKSYLVQWSYTSCTSDDVRLDEGVAFPMARPFYLDGLGAQQWISECVPRLEEPYALQTTREGCAAVEDLDDLKAKTKARVIYKDRAGKTKEARRCELDGETVPIVWSDCGITHDLAKGKSWKKRQAAYEIDGKVQIAKACVSDGTAYSHYTTTDGCESALNFDNRTVNLRRRKVVQIDGAMVEVAACAPSADTNLSKTAEGCEGVYMHNVAAGYTEQAVRWFYTSGGQRQYAPWGCTAGGTKYQHVVRTVGWEPDDVNLRAWPIQKTVAVISGSDVAVTEARVNKQAAAVPYKYIEKAVWPAATPTYSGCEKEQQYSEGKKWERPDKSLYQQETRSWSEPMGYACNRDLSNTRYADPVAIEGNATAVTVELTINGGVFSNPYSQLVGATLTNFGCMWPQEVALVREDGKQMGWAADAGVMPITKYGATEQVDITYLTMNQIGKVYTLGDPSSEIKTTETYKASFPFDWYKSIVGNETYYERIRDESYAFVQVKCRAKP